MHLVNQEALGASFHRLDGKKAVGIDGVTKAQYGEDLEARLEDLVERMKRLAYRPGPVREVQIPKEGKPGATRPLGISNLEDKLVQGAMGQVLESIYEPLFLDCSYGFRPGRGCHDAIRALQNHLFRHRVETVIDVDVSNYFGSIDHAVLLTMLSDKIRDKRFLRYLARMFKAGVLAEGELRVTDEGVPQGSVCSPILANIFAHYVIDEWFETVVKAHCAGRVAMFRYADDIVVCCEHERDALRIHRALGNRLAKYGLKLNEDKTRLVSFSREARRLGQHQGGFDFLGFCFYWGRSRQGALIPKLKTSSSRLRAKLQRVKSWLRAVSCRFPVRVWWPIFCAKLRGHVQYFGVSFNLDAVKRFLYHATRHAFRRLNRRSQRRSYSWAQFWRFVERHPLPRARVCHSLM
jgi:group II intron reverse transcriptase/maturase